MNRAPHDPSRSQRSPGALAPPWRAAVTRLLVALAAALSPTEGAATTATDLCTAAADPCQVTTSVSVTPGSVIDLGTRRLVIANHGTLDLQSGTLTLSAGELSVEAGGALKARGNAQDPGGKIIAVANSIMIAGSIDASGAPGGTVTLTSMGALTLAGPLEVRSRATQDGGGSADLNGTDVTITAMGKINALGGGSDFGGDVQISASGSLVVAGGIDASGGDGGSIDLIADAAMTINAGVVVKADAMAGGGSGGDITVSATGDLTFGGELSAAGRNGSTDTGAGDGGTVTVEGSSVTAVQATARIDVSAGSPDGIGGDVDVSGIVGAVDYRGTIEAQGPGVDGDGGNIGLDAAGALSVGGAIDAGGGRGGGGGVDLTSAADLTVSALAVVSVAASSSGDGGDVDVSGQGLVTILGTLISDGGPTQGGNAGSTRVSGCTVRVESSARLTSLRSNGTNTLIGRDLAIIAGTVRADPGSGRNVLRFAGPDYEPAILPNAQITPAAILIEDASVVPCNPVNTRTPTLTRLPTATRTSSVAATPTITRTPTPVPVACVGDCDGSSVVTVSELITGVNIALGSQPVSSCPAFDPDLSGTVTVNELILAVNNALDNCGQRVGAAPI